MIKWTLELTDDFDVKYQKLNLVAKKRIYHFLNVKLLNHPDPEKLAKSLQGTLKGMHRFRIGDYRVLVKIKRNVLVIVALDVDHRKDIYK
jgi:mRNA interferase RelE/StbE